MDKKTLILISVVFAALVLGMIIFAYLKYSEINAMGNGFLIFG